MTTLVHKRSDVAGKEPTASQLVDGEIAINTKDGKLYTLADGVVVTAGGIWESSSSGDIHYTKGHVAIGELPSADHTLSVAGTSDEYTLKVSNTSTTQCAISLNDNNTTGHTSVGIAAIGDTLSLRSGASEQMQINSAGLVGINGTPGTGAGTIGGGTDELQVNGDAFISGKLTVGFFEGDGSLLTNLPVQTPPVQSVNGKIGDVVLDAADVGAIPDTYVAPVLSVNGEVGAVVLTPADIGADTAGTSYTKAQSDAKYHPIFSENTAFNKNFGTSSTTVAKGNHLHTGVYTPFGEAYTKAEADARYTLASSSVDAYTKSQSDGRYVPKSGNTTISGTLTAVDFVSTSDARAKSNIQTVASDVVGKLNGRVWEWKDTGRKSSGVIAQELDEAGLDYLVHTNEDGMKSVAYNGLVAYLIEEVKALRTEVEGLK